MKCDSVNLCSRDHKQIRNPNFLSHFYCVLHLTVSGLLNKMPNEGDFNDNGYFPIPTGTANTLEDTLSEYSTESEYGKFQKVFKIQRH